jgi:hypothetical protein
MKFPVFYRFTTSNLKLSMFPFDGFCFIATLISWNGFCFKQFQTITKHRIGFVLCFESNGTFLWLSFIFSLKSVIIIVSEAGDRTKKQLKCSGVISSPPDKSCVLTMKIGSLNSTLTYLSSTCCKIGFVDVVAFAIWGYIWTKNSKNNESSFPRSRSLLFL